MGDPWVAFFHSLTHSLSLSLSRFLLACTSVSSVFRNEQLEQDLKSSIAPDDPAQAHGRAPGRSGGREARQLHVWRTQAHATAHWYRIDGKNSGPTAFEQIGEEHLSGYLETKRPGNYPKMMNIVGSRSVRIDIGTTNPWFDFRIFHAVSRGFSVLDWRGSPSKQIIQFANQNMFTPVLLGFQNEGYIQYSTYPHTFVSPTFPNFTANRETCLNAMGRGFWGCYIFPAVHRSWRWESLQAAST